MSSRANNFWRIIINSVIIIVIGILLGLLIFFAQNGSLSRYLKNYFSSNNSSPSASATPSPIPTHSYTTYTNKTTHVSFKVPYKSTVLEENVDNLTLGSGTTNQQLTLLTQPISGVQQKYNLTIYILTNTSGISSISSTDIRKITNLSLTGYNRDYNFIDSNPISNIAHTRYFSNTQTFDVYQWNGNFSDVFVLAENGSSDLPINSLDLQTLLQSITDVSTAPSSPSPSPSASSTLLLNQTP
jgi:hypothetical protein